MNKISSFSGEYRWLSNFWLVQISPLGDGIVYQSVEHAYQAAKTDNLSDRVIISNLSTPGQAKRFGRTLTIRKDWEMVKEDVMLTSLRCKFSFGSGLASQLLQTKDSILEEGNSWGDVFWGVCNGVGENRLGKLLMQVRTELNTFTLL